MTSLALSLDPKAILDSLSPYGEIGLMLIIFAETGLLVGFFLPGDSLMFTAGLLASQGSLNLALVLAGCFAAAVIGDQVGFTIGEVLGPARGAQPEGAVHQTRVHRAHPHVLRAPRTEDDRAREVRADRSHVHARGRRRRSYEEVDVPPLQHRRRRAVGGDRDAPRLSPRRPHRRLDRHLHPADHRAH